MSSAPGTKLFGTDGMRGTFGEPPLDAATVRRLAHALADQLVSADGAEVDVVIGGDTRTSTPQICQWIADALGERRVRVLDLGVAPTPAVAHLVPRLGAAAGVVVSASHNPPADNGIKIFGADGFKLSPAQEEALTRAVAGDAHGQGRAASEGRSHAPPRERRVVDREPVGRYLESLLGSVGEQRLDGLRIVLDSGHGAAAGLAAELFRQLGASVHALHDQPDGSRINVGCGSTAPEVVARAVAEAGDLGFAFDGDADRVIVCDSRGVVHDGDAVLYVWAAWLASRGELPGPAIVATSMSNLGLERALARHGVAVVRCDVGDRAVVETLRRERLRLGGEQSGHLVDLELATTGDGILSALQIAAIVARSGVALEELARPLERYPQVLRSIPVHSRPPFESLPEVQSVVADIERRLAVAEGFA